MDRGPPPGGRARRATMRSLAAYAALLGLAHGVAASLQGPGVVPSLPFLAVGPPCRPEAAWHGCLPALTIVPDARASGVLAVAAAGAVALAALAPLRRPGRVLAVASLGLFLVGGGFIPPAIAGFAAFVAPAPVRAARRGVKRGGRLRGQDGVRGRGAAGAWARTWPWSLVAYLGLAAAQLAGGLAGWDVVRTAAPVLLVGDLALLAVTVAGARAHDRAGTAERDPGP